MKQTTFDGSWFHEALLSWGALLTSNIAYYAIVAGAIGFLLWVMFRRRPAKPSGPLMPCPSCEHQGAPTAKACPSCGYAIAPPFLGRSRIGRLIGATVVVLLILWAIGQAMN